MVGPRRRLPGTVFFPLIPDRSWYDNGTSPYVLYDADDLYSFALLCQTDDFAGKTVRLGSDIDLNPGWTADANGGTGAAPTEWTPAGSPSKPFAGTFDGQGHTVSGLYLSTAGAYKGLFGDIGDGATVQDLHLTNSVLISDGQYLGSIAGRSMGTIRDVFSDAVVKSSKGRVGGLAGIACGADSVLEKCLFDGTVINTGSTSAVQGTGGLVGYVSNDTAGRVSIRNCLFSGTVDVSAYVNHPAAVAGGLVGYVVKNTTVAIDGCLASGSIDYPGNVTTLVGPIAGIVEEGSLNNVLLLSRTYAVDTIPSLSGTHVVTGDNFSYDVPVADSFIYVSAGAITGAAAQTAMPLLGWGTDWKTVTGKLPEIDFGNTASAVSLTPSSADRSQLSSLYSGRTLYQGELHDHADTSVGSNNGTSDGYTEVTTWYSQMPELGLDFAASLDHQQTRHIDDGNWDKSKLIYGSEAGTTIPNASDNGATSNDQHYSMLFRTKAQFETVLNAFSEFNYGGWNGIARWMLTPEGRTNEGTAQFRYPNFTRARFAELIEAVQDAGGFFVLPHVFSTDEANSGKAVDYDFGVDGMGLEVIYAGHSTDNHLYALWKELLGSGAKIYASAGTDGHRDLENTCLTSIYGTSAAALDKGYLIDRLRAGDFVAGSAGIQMSVGTTAMGGTCGFAGKRVVVDVEKIHVIANDLSHNYRLDVINDKGVVCSMKLTVNSDGSVGSGAELAFDADASSAFYRVVVVDCNTRSRIAIGNPIWND